jgi:hypothetical protein
LSHSVRRVLHLKCYKPPIRVRPGG